MKKEKNKFISSPLIIVAASMAPTLTVAGTLRRRQHAKSGKSAKANSQTKAAIATIYNYRQPIYHYPKPIYYYRQRQHVLNSKSGKSSKAKKITISQTQTQTAATLASSTTTTTSTTTSTTTTTLPDVIEETSAILTATATLPKVNERMNDDWDCSSPHETFPLGLCEGECDKDCHCDGDLICYQRGADHVVPGCDGPSNPSSKSDFCVDPRAVDAIRKSLYDFNNTDFSSQYSGISSPTRIRLFWHEVYYWQETRDETFWCMQCEGPCEEGRKIKVNVCDETNERQYFIAVNETIRPKLNTTLCMMETGFNSEDKPVRLSPCNGTESQQFWGYKEEFPFELRPRTDTTTCLTQMHHPKAHEAVFPRNCTKVRENDSSLWVTY